MGMCNEERFRAGTPGMNSVPLSCRCLAEVAKNSSISGVISISYSSVSLSAASRSASVNKKSFRLFQNGKRNFYRELKIRNGILSISNAKLHLLLRLSGLFLYCVLHKFQAQTFVTRVF